MNKGRVWLIVDANFLYHRAFHTTGQLTSGVTFGFLRDIMLLQDLHATRNVQFCFDKRPFLRELDHPTYKLARRQAHEYNEEETLLRDELYEQINLLKKQYLPDIGYRNIFWERGYEGDDIIAQQCLNLPRDDKAIIVSSDHDMLQLLVKDRIMLWSPRQKRMVTEGSFSKQYGITPTQWVDTLAMAGCRTDGVTGIKGIGPVSACSFLTGKLTKGKKFEAIVTNNGQWKKNLPLVRLPYPGTPVFETRKDRVTPKSWRKVTDELDMKSLRNAMS